MPDTKKKIINKKDLEEKAKNDPKSKAWNNPNSRKNLKQYIDSIVPEIIDEASVDEDSQVSAIVVGRKLNPELVKRLLPQRGVLTPAEKKRFVGIVTQYLSDFKNEEPTAADIDDIFEIAKSDIFETRLYQFSRDQPETLVAIGQAVERINKRKQTAKENLSARRSDRKGLRASQDISIVDLVVRHDLEQKKREEIRVAELLNEEDIMRKKLSEVLEQDD